MALDRFGDALQNVSTREDFLLPQELLERILRFHIHCDRDIQEINDTLDQEIDEMQQILEQEARSFVSGGFKTQCPHSLWSEALKSIPMPAVEKDGLIGLYQSEVNRLAKRRFLHAIRGKVDIGLQTGTMNISTAAAYLKETGINVEQTMSSVRKYTLNPGYQLCYTLGLRRFLDLFHRYGDENLQNFVPTVLGQGEIDFADLEKILRGYQ